MEIVTAPDLRSPAEARTFLRKLEETLSYLDVFDPNRDGSLRVDANISLIPTDTIDGAGKPAEDILASANRTEVKNISSHKGAEKALTYEIARQRNAITHGRTVPQETRHWDEDKAITLSMRAKEAEADYRYFREADLPVLRVADWTDQIEIPELPGARRDRFQRQYGLTAEAASKLTTTKPIADFYENVTAEFDPDLAATWVADNLLGELNYRDSDIKTIVPRLPEFKRLIELVATGSITRKHAEEIVLRRMLDDDLDPDTIIDQENLTTADEDTVKDAVANAIHENPGAVADYTAGEETAINYLVGKVMETTRGSADPSRVNQLLRDQLDP